MPAAELCRKYGVSGATFYKWRSKYGGMEVSDARKLKGLEDENRRLKKLLAESMLDPAMPTDFACCGVKVHVIEDQLSFRSGRAGN